jgi:hypothetical protein
VKPTITIYCEGSDTKIAVLTKEKDKIKVFRTLSIDMVHPTFDIEDEAINSLSIEGEDVKIENMNKADVSTTASMNMVAAAFKGISLNNAQFIPALTEPSIYYHIFEGNKEGRSAKLTQEIISDIQ